MALVASDIINRAIAIYNDTGYDRISNLTTSYPNWFQFIDDALLQIILVRPDAYNTTTTMLLSSGTKQTLPTAAVRLLDITRNMGTDGATPGKPILPVSKKILNLAIQTWHTETAQAEVDNFYYDTENPTIFYVYPQNDGTQYIELVYSQLHAAITGTGDSIGLKDIFLNPILSWCLYRAFSIDTDSPFGLQWATHYYQDFFNSLGVGLKVMQEVSPKENE